MVSGAGGLRSRAAKEIARAARDLGYERLDNTGTGHLRFKHPATGKVVICASADSGKRQILNSVAELKRGARPPEAAEATPKG